MKKHADTTEVEILQKVVDKLPHEKDQSIDPAPPKRQKIIKQAAADLNRGLTDTDRSSAMNATYKKQKL
jgi:uncharacterized protein YpuA (DUF1002 family)